MTTVLAPPVGGGPTSAPPPLPRPEPGRAARARRRRALDQLAAEARSQDWIRVFVPGADQVLTEGIEQIVLRGEDPATAWRSITPRIDTAYRENVEPYL